MSKESEWLCANHEYHLLTFVNSQEEEKLYREHASHASRVLSNKPLMAARSLIHPLMPLLFSVRTSLSFALKLIGCVKKYDIDAIHAEYTSMGQYVWIKKFFPHLKFNIVEHDITKQSYIRQEHEALGLKKLFVRNQLKKVSRLENKYLSRADTIFTLSKKDTNLIKKYYPQIQSAETLAPYFGIEENETSDIVVKSNDEFIICFVGQMGRKENNDAALRLIDIYKNGGFDDSVKLRIIGANPSEEIKAYQSDSIEVTGFVSDINETIEQCSLAVFPLISGAGIKLKVLLAASLGLPVITTSVGAEGIDEDGEAIVLAETDQEIVDSVRKMCEDEKYYMDKIEAIGNLVKERFSWSKSEAVLEKVYPKGQ